MMTTRPGGGPKYRGYRVEPVREDAHPHSDQNGDGSAGPIETKGGDLEQPAISPLLAARDDAPRFWLPGGYDRIRLSARQTGGVLGVTESEETNQDATPMHIHEREDETFYILEGTYTFVIGDETIRAEAGSLVFAPRGVTHAYRIESPRGRYLCVITPGGWEEFFAEAGVPARDDFVLPEQEPDWDSIGAIAGRYGVSIVGPPLTEERA